VKTGRRGFLAALAALPVVARLKGPAPTDPLPAQRRELYGVQPDEYKYEMVMLPHSHSVGGFYEGGDFPTMSQRTIIQRRIK
jgi:hypothetical protein